MWNMARIMAVVGIALVCASGAQAQVVIDTITVGNPGNGDDTHGDGYGGVAYTYNIGKYEVTNSQYAQFLNAVATVGDPNGLYNTEMGGGWNDIGGISRDGDGTVQVPWVYTPRDDCPNRPNSPVNYVSWYDALRFANWMHNGQPTGGQDTSTTEDGAYDMSLGSSVVRKPGAQVFLPSEDEWYKAAYYKGGGTDAGYWDYPTQSDTVPPPELPPGTDMVNGSANYYSGDYLDPLCYTTRVGAYDAKPSDSAYGTFDQGGNLWEWNEAKIVSDRCVRGGSFGGYDGYLHAANIIIYDPTIENIYLGFRVAAVPEPIPTVSQWGLIVLALPILGAGAVVLRSRRTASA